jgi:Bacteriophage minor capsid protein
MTDLAPGLAPPVPAQPDVEAWVWANVRHLPGVTSFAFSGITDWPGWQTRTGIQVDCRASRKKAARDLAEQVRQIVLGLPDVAWDAGQITYVSVADGPVWLPDDSDGTPRYTTRFELRVHPPR